MKVHESKRRDLRIKCIGGALVLFFALAGVAWAGHSGDMDFDVMMSKVVLGSGAAVDVHMKVYVNESNPCSGKVIFAVHGFAHTSATWAPFADEIFKDNPTGRKVCQIVAIDLPSRGGTTLPGIQPFASLTLEDDVTILQTALKRLPTLGIRPDTMMSHSQGGLLIQMTQQALKNNMPPTNLRDAFGIKNVVMLAPVGPAELPWDFVDSGTAELLLGLFSVTDPNLGSIISVPDAAWPSIFFSNFSNPFVVPIDSAPMPADVTGKGYNAVEPIFAAAELAGLQLPGLPPFARPSVDQGIFTLDSGTELQIVAFENDIIVLTTLEKPETRMLYKYLTGDDTYAGWVEVFGADAVHDTFISGPRMLLDAIAGTIELP